jgi:hypothetical protein
MSLGVSDSPDSDRKFESVYPKKAVQVLEDIDPGIHEVSTFHKMKGVLM